MVDPTTGNDQRPLLILVQSGMRSFREYFFRSVAPRYRIWLFLGGPGRPAQPDWQVPYLAGYTTVDTGDPGAMLEHARRLARAGSLGGILCYDEARIHATAEVARELGLAGPTPEAVARCRDKFATRRALAEAGVPQAGSIAVRSLDEARDAAGRLGYPLVLKPRNLAASFGVIKVPGPDELAEAYAYTRDTWLPEEKIHYEDGVLVEEYLDGPEFSVDSACFAGRVVPLAVARKQTAYPPYFEETGHLVDGAEPLDDELVDVVTRAHRALGYDAGITHAELRRTPAGWKVIEINGRLGGDLIPYLGHLATGVDLSLAAAAIACGEEPDLTPTRRDSAAIRFYYPESAITIRSIDFDPALVPDEVVRAQPMLAPGNRALLPPEGFAWESRLAYAVAVAPDPAACHAALDQAGKALVVREAAEAGAGGGA